MDYPKIFDSEVLYHYTNFNSAIKILSSMKLRFGEFKNLNDIAENSMEVYSTENPTLVEEELNKYRTISLTIDKINLNNRGFSIESLWGYYAEKGNGVCLVFNKKCLLQALKDLKKDSKCGKIKYVSGPNANFVSPQNGISYKKYIKSHLKELFFYKDKAWRHEQEYRLLIYSNDSSLVELPIKNCLVGVVLCSPHFEKISETPEYIAISHIAPQTPIMRYKRKLGNKTLEDCNGVHLWPVIGKDYDLNV